MVPAATDVETRGFAVVRSLFAPAFVAGLRDAWVEWLRGASARGEALGADVGDRRTMIPVPLRPPFLDEALLLPEALVPVFDALLGGDYVLNSLGAVVAMPGAAPQPRHKDHAPLFPDLPSLPCHALTVVVPLVELDDATGTTALVEGSHREREGEVVEPHTRLGDAYLMDYRLSHWGTANRSPRVRPILYAVYSRPWFLDERNFADLPALDAVPGVEIPQPLRPLLRRVRAARPAMQGGQR